MSIATLFGIGVIGTFFWPASPEAAAALVASQHRAHPLVIAVVATGGQAVALTALFLFGAQLRQRWKWFDRKCERVRVSVGDRMAHRAVILAATSGLLGFPPASVSATLAPALAPRPAMLLPVLLALRVVRFGVVAALAAHLGRNWPPW